MFFKHQEGDHGKRKSNKFCDEHGKGNMLVKINEMNHADEVKPD